MGQSRKQQRNAERRRKTHNEQRRQAHQTVKVTTEHSPMKRGRKPMSREDLHKAKQLRNRSRSSFSRAEENLRRKETFVDFIHDAVADVDCIC
jgi:hypothetical protein